MRNSQVLVHLSQEEKARLKLLSRAFRRSQSETIRVLIDANFVRVATVSQDRQRSAEIVNV